jgi:FkbM family methyltransferase
MLLDQLYKPTLKINKINYFLRFISIFIIKIFFLDKIKIFSNCFQQQLNTYLVMSYNKKKFFFKDGNERLYWRYKTQFQEENKLCEWIDTFKKGDIFCDVGSNVGMFTVYAAKRNIITYSFEPHPANLDKLYYNVFLNQVNKNVIVLPFALSNKSKIETFIFRDMTAGCAKNFLGSKSTTAINFKYLSTSMDNLFMKYKIKYPNKIKIDVDGNELDILNGMNKILKVCDEIYIELTNSKNKKDYYNNKIYKFLIKKNFYLHNFYDDNFLFKKK